MKKDIQTILNEYKKELKENDLKVQKEINTKSRTEMSKDFVKFVKKNNCKIKDIKGDKNGK